MSYNLRRRFRRSCGYIILLIRESIEEMILITRGRISCIQSVIPGWDLSIYGRLNDRLTDCMQMRWLLIRVAR